MKKDTGYKILCLTLLTYAIIFMAESINFPESSIFTDNLTASIIVSVPLIVHILCLVTLCLSIWMIIDGD